MKKKQYIKGFVQKIEGDIVSAVATTDSVDRDNETVSIDGWDLKSFNDNPILLWAHRSAEPPIGKITNIWREGNALKFDAVFAKGDVFVDRLVNLVKQGILKAFSVGFIAKDMDSDGNSLEQELLEISLVPVPANQDARMMSAYKSFCKDFSDRIDIEEPKEEPKEEVKLEDKPEEKEEVKEEVKEEEPKEEVKEEPKEEVKEEIKMTENKKNRLRLFVDNCEEMAKEGKEILKIAKSVPTEKVNLDTKVADKPQDPQVKMVKVMKRLSKEVEIALSQAKNYNRMEVKK